MRDVRTFMGSCEFGAAKLPKVPVAPVCQLQGICGVDFSSPTYAMWLPGDALNPNSQKRFSHQEAPIGEVRQARYSRARKLGR